MPTTNYIHANGVKIAQIKDGVRTDFLTDALGSVTATKNQSQQIVNTYRYKPYGKLLARTGSGDDPRYLWTGNTGSRVTQTRNVNQYNVARHYANGPASWTSVDPIWPREWAYGYVSGKPSTNVDPTGLFLIFPRPIFSPPIPGQRPSPGMPGTSPIMDPENDAFINQCSAIGWGMIIEDIKKFLWPPKRDVVIPPIRMSGELCAQYYKRYSNECKKPRSCKNVAVTDCGKLESLRDRNMDCVSLRYIVIKYCDTQPPNDHYKKPAKCNHIVEMCNAMSNACDCSFKMRQKCGIMVNPDWLTCTEWQARCIGAAAGCGMSKDLRFKFPPT